MSEKIETQLIQIKVILLVGFSIVLIGVFTPDDMEPTVGGWILGIGGTALLLYGILRIIEWFAMPGVDSHEQDLEEQLEREKGRTGLDDD